MLVRKTQRYIMRHKWEDDIKNNLIQTICGEKLTKQLGTEIPWQSFVMLVKKFSVSVAARKCFLQLNNHGLLSIITLILSQVVFFLHALSVFEITVGILSLMTVFSTAL
jgi:hypothetical protein